MHLVCFMGEACFDKYLSVISLILHNKQKWNLPVIGREDRPEQKMGKQPKSIVILLPQGSTLMKGFTHLSQGQI